MVIVVLCLALAGCAEPAANYAMPQDEVWLLTWADGSTREVVYKRCEVNSYITEGGFLSGAAVASGNMVFVECFAKLGVGVYPKLALATQVMIAERLQ